jgi:molecular chaperone HscC
LLRGEQRQWFGSQIIVFERILETQDDRQIDRNRKEFEQVLDSVEHQYFINPSSFDPG